jgi:hypothetical protein
MVHASCLLFPKKVSATRLDYSLHHIITHYSIIMPCISCMDGESQARQRRAHPSRPSNDCVYTYIHTYSTYSLCVVIHYIHVGTVCSAVQCSRVAPPCPVMRLQHNHVYCLKFDFHNTTQPNTTQHNGVALYSTSSTGQTCQPNT